MTYEIRREECGCVVQQDHDASVFIIYCPLHHYASDLYEALKAIVSEPNYSIFGIPGGLYLQIKDALAKVSGFEDHTLEDAEYDWKRDKEGK